MIGGQERHRENNFTLGNARRCSASLGCRRCDRLELISIGLADGGGM